MTAIYDNNKTPIKSKKNSLSKIEVNPKIQNTEKGLKSRGMLFEKFVQDATRPIDMFVQENYPPPSSAIKNNNRTVNKWYINEKIPQKRMKASSSVYTISKESVTDYIN